jgi:hypothetical protein
MTINAILHFLVNGLGGGEINPVAIIPINGPKLIGTPF